MDKNFSQNFLQPSDQGLNAIFYPQAVAIIGASEREGSIGKTLVKNLLEANFSGKIFPVNPARETVLGIPCYRNIAAIANDRVDLAIIATPAASVPDIIRECGQNGVRGAIVISAGFKESGDEGRKLEKRLIDEAKKHNIRIIGPNCLGIIYTHANLNATFATNYPHEGNIAFISQSGALGTAVLDWSLQEQIGFSAFISMGSMADVNFGDVIEYLGNDNRTSSILIYMETLGDASSFIAAARKVSHTKPIILIKAGKTPAAARAAASHTGSIAGADEVFNTCIRRGRILRVHSIAELFNMALVLSKQPLPKGPNLCIITNAGGPAVLATDAAITDGLTMVDLTSDTKQCLNQILPKTWSGANPIDIIGDADPKRYEKTLEIVKNQENIDGILVILTPQSMTDPTTTAKHVLHMAKNLDKPLLASWMGGNLIAEGKVLLNNSSIPTFDYPDDAARAFAMMWQHQKNISALYQTPAIRDTTTQESKQQYHHVKSMIDAAYKENRRLLTLQESLEILQAYHIPILTSKVACNVEEAVRIAAQIGFPVAMKLHSKTITHKSDIGGVKLNVENTSQVKKSFLTMQESVTQKGRQEDFLGVVIQPMATLQGIELLLGALSDPQFGPVLAFGTGGKFVEIFKDQVLALPPLNLTLATKIMAGTKVYGALQGARGDPPKNLEKLQEILVNFSTLILEHPRIAECDINPLLAYDREIVALDARIALHEKDLSARDLPRPIIAPYPLHLSETWMMNDTTPIKIRAVTPNDEEKLKDFSLQFNQEHPLSINDDEIERLSKQVCSDNYASDLLLIAEKSEKIIGLARLIRLRCSKQATFKCAALHHDQKIHIERKLLEKIISVAKERNFHDLFTYIDQNNFHHLRICQEKKFTIDQLDDGNFKASLTFS